MRIYIRDLNHPLIDALKAEFGGGADVDIAHGDILDLECDAIVSPANSFGFMDGGVDLAYSRHFGWHLQQIVQDHIASMQFGECLVGRAFAVPTGNDKIPTLICAPTMRVPKVITDPADVFLATRAAMECARYSAVSSVAFPGMGTGCGMVAPALAAKAMNAGIKSSGRYRRYDSLRDASFDHYRFHGGSYGR